MHGYGYTVLTEDWLGQTVQNMQSLWEHSSLILVSSEDLLKMKLLTTITKLLKEMNWFTDILIINALHESTNEIKTKVRGKVSNLLSH